MNIYTNDFVEKTEAITNPGQRGHGHDVKSLFTIVPVDDAYAEIERVSRADPGMGVEAVLNF